MRHDYISIVENEFECEKGIEGQVELSFWISQVLSQLLDGCKYPLPVLGDCYIFLSLNSRRKGCREALILLFVARARRNSFKGKFSGMFVL